jgi:cytochrome P450
MLLPAFTPEAIARREPRTRDICRELIGRIAGNSRCNAAVDHAQEIPIGVIAHMLDVPERETPARQRAWQTASPRASVD